MPKDALIVSFVMIVFFFFFFKRILIVFVDSPRSVAMYIRDCRNKSFDISRVAISSETYNNILMFFVYFWSILIKMEI